MPTTPGGLVALAATDAGHVPGLARRRALRARLRRRAACRPTACR
ncbi:hypothetical protein ACX12M_18785 [Cellulosimicrobium cellulans]